MPDLTYLRELMGNDWIDTTVCGDKPNHLLGRQYKHDKNNPWVLHVEDLLGEILNNPKIRFDTRTLVDKIKEPYSSTVTEMESAVFLARQGFEITLEPNAPNAGPDIRAERDGIAYFIEVRAMGLSEDEERRERLTNEIFSRMSTVPSSYSARFIVGDKYFAGWSQTRTAIDAAIEALQALKERRYKRAKFYFAPPDGKLLVEDGASYSSDETIRDILQPADFVVQFVHLGKEMTGTPASLMKAVKSPPEPVNDHERLRKVLENKRKQLPKGSRGVITLDVTEQFMLSDFSVENALYGDLVVQIKATGDPREPVGEAIPLRNARGFFRKTSRVSAVVFQNRRVEEGSVKINRRVYPTNRANLDTIRLDRVELERLGELEDREHLTAEHAPNHVDENLESEKAETP